MSVLSRLFGVRIRCQNCGRNYRPNLREEAFGAGIARYTECPHCGIRVVVAIITSLGAAIIEEIGLLDPTDPEYRESLERLQRRLQGEVRRP